MNQENLQQIVGLVQLGEVAVPQLLRFINSLHTEGVSLTELADMAEATNTEAGSVIDTLGTTENGKDAENVSSS